MMELILKNGDYLAVDNRNLTRILNVFLDTRAAVEMLGGEPGSDTLYMYGILQHDRNGELSKVTPEERKRFFSKNLAKIDKEFKKIVEKGYFFIIKKAFEKPFTFNEYQGNMEKEIFKKESSYLKDIISSSGINLKINESSREVQTYVADPAVYAKKLKSFAARQNGKKISNKDASVALALHMNERSDNGILNPLLENDVVYYDEIFGKFENLKRIKKEFKSLGPQKSEPVKETGNPG
jgi:hypothetical protein